MARLIGFALALYLRLVARTVRLSGEVTTDQAVVAFWHEFNLASFVIAIMRRQHLRHASFSTRGFRGNVITTMLRHSGTDVVVLPLPEEARRAEAKDLALRLAALTREGRSPVVTPDGPFGPYRIVKPGALIIARESGLPLVPWAVSVRPDLRLSRRWDRQRVPLPFGRLRLEQGEPIHLDPREPLRPQLSRLQAALDEVASRSDAGSR